MFSVQSDAGLYIQNQREPRRTYSDSEWSGRNSVPGGRGYNWATLGVPNLRWLKYGHESCGTRTAEKLLWRRPAITDNYRPALSPERGRITSANPNCLASNKNVVTGPRWVPETKTDWPTGCHFELRVDSVSSELGAK
jgi:hypothetical protein